MFRKHREKFSITFLLSKVPPLIINFNVYAKTFHTSAKQSVFQGVHQTGTVWIFRKSAGHAIGQSWAKISGKLEEVVLSLAEQLINDVCHSNNTRNSGWGIVVSFPPKVNWHNFPTYLIGVKMFDIKLYNF